MKLPETTNLDKYLEEELELDLDDFTHAQFCDHMALAIEAYREYVGLQSLAHPECYTPQNGKEVFTMCLGEWWESFDFFTGESTNDLLSQLRNFKKLIEGREKADTKA